MWYAAVPRKEGYACICASTSMVHCLIIAWNTGIQRMAHFQDLAGTRVYRYSQAGILCCNKACFSVAWANSISCTPEGELPITLDNVVIADSESTATPFSTKVGCGRKTYTLARQGRSPCVKKWTYKSSNLCFTSNNAWPWTMTQGAAASSRHVKVTTMDDVTRSYVWCQPDPKSHPTRTNKQIDSVSNSTR